MAKIERKDTGLKVGKTIGIPSRLTTGLMHRPNLPRDIEGNYTHQVLNKDGPLAVHLREKFDKLEVGCFVGGIFMSVNSIPLRKSFQNHNYFDVVGSQRHNLFPIPQF